MTKKLVDDEIYLHSESDPRYKGSAIPSKAFKALQTMTDGAPNNVAGKLNFCENFHFTKFRWDAKFLKNFKSFLKNWIQKFLHELP